MSIDDRISDALFDYCIAWRDRASAVQDKVETELRAAIERHVAEAAKASGIPTEAAAHALGQTGSPAIDGERLAFEAWVRGHGWALGAMWDGTSYRGTAEHGAYVCPVAMNTRRMWAAWRDRAALSRSRGESTTTQGNDMSIEQEIQAAGANVAPRITPADIEASIWAEHYFTAADGCYGASADRISPRDIPMSLRLLTICVIVMSNGFTVTGESACASPENFNAEIGRGIARRNAITKIWPLLGYELRTKLSARADNEVTK